MANRLENKIAIVTGGSRGIGEQIADAFIAEGAQVLIVGRDRARGEAVATRIGAKFLRADIGNPASARKIADTAKAAFGRVDILVNCAGTPGRPGGFEDPSALDEVMKTNVGGAWRLTAAVAPMMEETGGSIVNIASLAGHRPGAIALAYSVSKAALLHLTRCLATELGPKRIRVNSISPGFIETDIHGTALGLEGPLKRRLNKKLAELFTAHQPLNMVGQPEDIAGAAVFLASNESSFVTGADIVIDGGLQWTAIQN